MLELSTGDVHPRDRLHYWQEVACRTFVEIECKTDVGPSFQGSIRSHALADIAVSIVDTDQCTVLRTSQGISRAKSDDVLISLQLAGRALVRQDGREAVLTAGDFALYDTERPYSLVVPSGTRQLVLKVPRGTIERRLSAVAKYTALTVEARNPIGGFASAFLQLLPSRADALDSLNERDKDKIAAQVLDLTTLAFRNMCGEHSASWSSAKAVRLARLKSIIEERLFDPRLKPPIAAHMAGLSVRYANFLLAEEGTSLEQYIISQRLERCRRALDDPTEAKRSVSEIAYSWGFADLSHFGRRFKDRFRLFAGRLPRQGSCARQVTA